MQRLCEILNADIVGIPQVGDVLSEFLLEGLEEALRRKVRSATVRVVDDRNIVDVEEMARNAIDRCALPDARPPATTTGKMVVFEPMFLLPPSPTNSKPSPA